MRKFHTITPMNTVGQWVDAFNNNALASSDHTVYLGEILFSSVLYTGLETICGKEVVSQQYIDLTGVFPEEFYFDNWYCYFRNENKIKLIEHQDIDLSDYKDSNLYFLFINSERGYRVSVNSTVIRGDEIRLCRFMINEEGRFVQCYPTFQRFGYFGSNDDYPEITGLDAKPFAPSSLIREDGRVDYDGIKFDFHDLPDSLFMEYREKIPIIYNNVENKIDYVVQQKRDEEGNVVVDDEGNPIYTIDSTGTTVDAKYYIDYENKEVHQIPNDMFSIQRILYDIYVDNYVLQYADGYYGSLDEALDAVYSVDFPFPFTDVENNIVGNAFPMIGMLVVKSNYTDLSDSEQCRILNIRSRSADIRDTELLATDSLARSLIMSLRRDLDALEARVADCENRLDENEQAFDDHVHNRFRPEDDDTYPWALAPNRNPHHVTPEDLGMGSFRINSSFDPEGAATYGDGVMYTPQSLPISTRTKDYIDSIKTALEQRISGLDNRFVRKTGDTMTGALTINNAQLICTGDNGEVRGTHVTVATDKYINVGGTRFYVGTLPGGAPDGSYGVKAG